MRSRFVLTASIATLLAGLSLTACSSSSTADASKSGGATPTSAAPVTGRPTSPVSTSSAAVTTAATGADGSQAAKCRTQNLKWTVTRLTDAGTDSKDPAQAELVAVNTGPHSCTLAGFPKLEFHVGKGPEALGVGKGSPAPLTLGVGKKAVIALRFSELNGKGPDSGDCLVTASSALVAAPGDSTDGRALLVDRDGKPAEVTICGDEVRMSPPVAR